MIFQKIYQAVIQYHPSKNSSNYICWNHSIREKLSPCNNCIIKYNVKCYYIVSIFIFGILICCATAHVCGKLLLVGDDVQCCWFCIFSTIFLLYRMMTYLTMALIIGEGNALLQLIGFGLIIFSVFCVLLPCCITALYTFII